MSGSEFHFNTDMEGWLNTGGTSWDGEVGHSAIGSLHSLRTRYTTPYFWKRGDVSSVVHGGDIISFWYYATPTISNRSIWSVNVNYTDGNQDSSGQHFSQPINQWVKGTYTIPMGRAGKTVSVIILNVSSHDNYDTVNIWIDDVFTDFPLPMPTPPVSGPYVKKSANGGSSFSLVTPSNRGSLYHRGILASVQAQNNVVALVRTDSETTYTLAVSSNSGTSWTNKQSGLSGATDIAGWDKLFWATSNAALLNESNGSGSNKDCTGNWLTETGEAFVDPVRIAVVW